MAQHAVLNCNQSHSADSNNVMNTDSRISWKNHDHKKKTKGFNVFAFLVFIFSAGFSVFEKLIKIVCDTLMCLDCIITLQRKKK